MTHSTTDGMFGDGELIGFEEMRVLRNGKLMLEMSAKSGDGRRASNATPVSEEAKRHGFEVRAYFTCSPTR